MVLVTNGPAREEVHGFGPGAGQLMMWICCWLERKDELISVMRFSPSLAPKHGFK